MVESSQNHISTSLPWYLYYLPSSRSLFRNPMAGTRNFDLFPRKLGQYCYNRWRKIFFYPFEFRPIIVCRGSTGRGVGCGLSLHCELKKENNKKESKIQPKYFSDEFKQVEITYLVIIGRWKRKYINLKRID